jgi:predicted dehydrogenase
MANIMIKPKLALIGTGNIAHFHCEAFAEAGFEISHAAGSLNSKTVEEFGKKHSIKNVFSNPHDILKNHQEWDAVLLSTPIDKNIDYLEGILELNKPALIEKPVAINKVDLLRFKENDFKNIRVAYNKRFYSTIQRAKEFIKNEDFVHLRMELPENIKSTRNYEDVLSNSCHGIDLLFYLFTDLEIQNNYVFKNDLGRLVTLKSKNNNLVSLSMNWNSPSNFMISLEGDRRRLEIKPFESGSIYQGMDLIEPTEDLPLRRYVPKKIESISSFPHQDNLIKPGFLEQAIEFKNILEGGSPVISASLYDAYKAQELLDDIL